MTQTIYHDYTVFASEVVDFTDETGFVLQATAGAPPTPSLFVQGTINVTGTVAGGHLIGIYTGDSSGYDQSLVHIETGGVLHVDAAGAGTAAFGVSAFMSSADLTNDGLIQVSSTAGDATGVFAEDANFVFDNSGDIAVSAWGQVSGVVMLQGGGFTNTGTITVEGGAVAATGVQTYGFEVFTIDYNYTVLNAGTVRVTDQTEARDSVAFAIADPAKLPATFTNTGLIEADWAFREDQPYFGGAQKSASTIVNGGDINGWIDLGGGTDTVDNHGTIVGDILLGDGADVYDGTGGVLDGTAHGGRANDSLVGGKGRDSFSGDAGDDLLSGGKAADHLDGGIGNDTLAGGKGADAMTGAAGADTFLFASAKDFVSGAHCDLIADLEASDIIDLSGVDADRTLKGDQAFTLVGAFDGHAGQLVLQWEASAGITYARMDTDGDGHADLTLQLTGDQAGHTSFVL